jgi:integrase
VKYKKFYADIDRLNVRQQTESMFEHAAANDDTYKSGRHRSLPILDTITPVPRYPHKLSIFLTNASRNWQVRCFMKDKTYTRSLRTTNKRVALAAARDFFHEVTAKVYGSIVNVKEERELLYEDLVEPTLAIERGRVARGEFGAATLRHLQARMKNTIVPFAGKIPIKRFGYAHGSDFIEMMSKKGMGSTTIQQHIVGMRKVLNYAYTNKIIDSVPQLPWVNITSNPRGHFSVDEYLKLMRAAKADRGFSIPIYATERDKRRPNKIIHYVKITEDFYWFIRFMVNSFVRPSDIKIMQHKHITVVRGDHVYLRLNLPETKKHNKPVVTMQAAVRVYERLLEWQKSQGYGRPDDHVFLPDVAERKVAMMRLLHMFTYVKNKTGVGDNKANGQSRTIYSLRHTAITFRLLYGGNIDLLTLARNARTSVDMVEQFYSSNLTGEMNIGLLQGKRNK